MDGIDIMVKEHENIKRMLAVVRAACIGIMNGNAIDYDDFRQMISFIRDYADKHHHNKEEKFLFNRMVEEGGEIAKNLVNYGMLMEHDLGRMYVRELEEALNKTESGDKDAKVDVIANAISYTNLLKKHIEKENNAAYGLARRQLSKETLLRIDEECENYEQESSKANVQEKNLTILSKLEKKYI